MSLYFFNSRISTNIHCQKKNMKCEKHVHAHKKTIITSKCVRVYVHVT